MEQLLLIITIPLYTLFIGLELYLGHLHGKKLYGVRDSINSILLGLGGVVVDLLMKGFGVLLFGLVMEKYSLFHFEKGFLYWLILFFAQDFCFYWLHRTEHNVRLFWAVHVNHHSSEKFNFTVALRSSMLQPLYRYFFFLPCAFLGFNALDVMFMYAINQVYQFFLHTETVGKLGVLEYLFVTPSHHRVHHASNTGYLDKNMGQVLIVWDRLFGTFQQEEESPVYGLTKNIQSQNFLVVWLHEWACILKDLRKRISWSTKLKYLFKPPGWSHDGSSQTARELVEKTK